MRKVESNGVGIDVERAIDSEVVEREKWRRVIRKIDRVSEGEIIFVSLVCSH